MKWKYTEFKLPSDILTVTDEMMAAWQNEFDECEEYNKKLFAEALQKRNIMIAYAKEIWGERSNIVKYIEKQSFRRPDLHSLDHVKMSISRAKEAKKKTEFEYERTAKHTELVGKAIVYLTQRNKNINIDFNVDNAIKIANDIAFEEEVVKKQESGEMFSFSGEDSCEDCAGWDGSSHRCSCGNRRVSWSSYDSDEFFLDPHIYGEAY